VESKDEKKREVKLLTAAALEGTRHLADQVSDRGLELLEEAWCHCEGRQRL